MLEFYKSKLKHVQSEEILSKPLDEDKHELPPIKEIDITPDFRDPVEEIKVEKDLWELKRNKKWDKNKAWVKYYKDIRHAIVGDKVIDEEERRSYIPPMIKSLKHLDDQKPYMANFGIKIIDNPIEYNEYGIRIPFVNRKSFDPSVKGAYAKNLFMDKAFDLTELDGYYRPNNLDIDILSPYKFYDELSIQKMPPGMKPRWDWYERMFNTNVDAKPIIELPRMKFQRRPKYHLTPSVNFIEKEREKYKLIGKSKEAEELVGKLPKWKVEAVKYRNAFKSSKTDKKSAELFNVMFRKQCPTCGKFFDKEVAKRHIPVCADRAKLNAILTRNRLESKIKIDKIKNHK